VPDNGEEHVEDSYALICPQGCRVPVVNGISRFVGSSNYASAFGLQWNKFRRTQLDSYTGTTISRDRLAGALGGSLDVVRGKSVLEVGCGAGRFTEVLLSAGARVFACDLSEAVEANYANCGHLPDYFICQADIMQLPASPLSFDVVLCLGVIQHTPNPEATIATLAQYVKPGGMLAIDHYSYEYPYTFSRRILRQLLIRLPATLSERVTHTLARVLLPLHKALRSKKWLLGSKRRGVARLRHYLRIERLRHTLLKFSPLVDYYDGYPQLGDKLLEETMILDTHDTLTDYYKHFRSVEEIQYCLASLGLTEIEVYQGGNGVEARAKRPIQDITQTVSGVGGP
jgi:2-polyprenyl-3-methyl-5-hydroxy-6-metoxy-1,4-benzoquinol methylase